MVSSGCFRVVSDLFLSLGYLSLGEKTGKNGKRKKRREKERRDKKQAPKTYSNCSHCGPERPAAVLMSTIRILFGCLLFRTAAGLSGPQWLQLEYVLGASFSGPLHVFPDHNGYN